MLEKVSIRERLFRYAVMKGVVIFNHLPWGLKSFISKRTGHTEISKKATICGRPLYKWGVKIGDYTYLNGNAVLENVSIGKYCSIGRDISIISGKHDLDLFSTYSFYGFDHKSPFFNYKDENYSFEASTHTEIGNDVWIGSYAKIIGGVNIGNGSVIGAGSIVTKDVPPYAIVAGSPARIIRYRFDEIIISKLQNLEWWEWDEEKLIREYDRLNELIKEK